MVCYDIPCLLDNVISIINFMLILVCFAEPKGEASNLDVLSSHICIYVCYSYIMAVRALSNLTMRAQSA